MTTEIGVLADDLTGALGSAARLRCGGLEPVVVWRPEDLPDAFRPRAVVVDTDARGQINALRVGAELAPGALRAAGARPVTGS